MSNLATLADHYASLNAQIKELTKARDAIRAQITNYFALKETAKDIIAITEIDDDTSVKVREQYEEFPYPRWIKPDSRMVK